MHPATGGAFLQVMSLTQPRERLLVVRVTAVLFMTLLTAAAAQVSLSIPFSAIPFTLQPMVVLLSGMVLGPRLGFASQVLYLAAGAAGLPVFAASPTLPPGVARLLGPSGGYLLSYPLAALFTGWLAARGFDRRYVTSLLAMAAGLTVIYAGGIGWLTLLGTASGASVTTAFGLALAAGLYPFLLADLLKLALASGMLPGMWRMLRS
jgi:biotin transport system substrate-specific component